MIRNQFQNRIEKGLFGAGSDSWGVDDSEELISDTPLNRYYTGILFPQKKDVQNDNSDNTIDNGDDEQEDTDESLDISNEPKENGGEYFDNPNIQTNFNIENQANTTEDKTEDKEDDEKAINRFFPNSMGMTFCLPSHIKTIEVEFSFGLYRIAKRSELKIKFPEKAYQTLIKDANFPLAHLLDYNDGFLSLK